MPVMSNPQEESMNTQPEPVEIGKKKKNHHWWQDVPRRLSFTRNRSNSECSDSSPATSPSGSGPPTVKQEERGRRFSETSAHSHEKTAEVRERWNRNYNIPPECFVPPWI